MAESESNDSAIFSQIMSTKRSKTALTWTFSFADASKNSKPEHQLICIRLNIAARTRAFSDDAHLRRLTQICNLTRLSPRKTVFTLKSMPTVETNADVNESSQ
ncbi:hypothetical protein M514_14502 [Trichuris suis]|uniref:Uncharacterized protein n=1 Tax=Trichuris suis TaxID=68888 RepID=A0A085NUL6_9BILA|nr:hypothetical protein M514_14502 [Trichuris suis]